MPLILALGRHRHVDLCEFVANLVYKRELGQAPELQRNLVLNLFCHTPAATFSPSPWM